MSASVGTGVFLLSLMSIPICYLFNSLIYSNSAEAFFFAWCTTVLILAISARFILKKKAPVDPLFYVYAVHAFLSVVNLIIGLEQDNIIDGFVTFYLKEANPHINTAHGHMISYWDGCVHYLMYLLMIAAITWGTSRRLRGQACSADLWTWYSSSTSFQRWLSVCSEAWLFLTVPANGAKTTHNSMSHTSKTLQPTLKYRCW
uniref:Transmembrane 6 superfamily member 1/2 transmembrane domain-containing protein n=1 Tax=Oreochromis aureus TaxID=47969 RepID=A0A668S2F1_OREAU